MAHISQTDFLYFDTKSGMNRIAPVRQIFNREEYNPAFDFYKKIREELVNYIKLGKSKEELFKFLNELPDSRKYPNYLNVVKGYLSLLGRKNVSWFEPPTSDWTYKDLVVRMNPELGLQVNNEKYIVKLYFKDEPIKRNVALVHLRLMQKTLCTGIFSSCKGVVLDLKNRKWHLPPVEFKPFIDSVIEAEAESFLTIWSALERKSA